MQSHSKATATHSTSLIALAAIAIFLASLIYSFPGTGNFDSNEQYAQAVSGNFTDWHPPVMAWLWSVLRFFADGNSPLFILHISCYWLGFGLTAVTLSRIGHTKAGWAVIMVGILPPFLSLSICIYKDVGLAVTFLAAFAIAFWHHSQNKKLHFIAVIFATLLLLYGILVRANGIFAGAPLLIYVFYPTLFSRPIRFLAVCLLIVAIAIPASGVFNHKLLQAKPDHPIRSLELFDITGIAYFSNDLSVFWEGPFTHQLVAECYTPFLWDTLAHGKCHIFWDSPSPDQTKKWISAIIRHPIAYMEHRITHFNSELGFIVQQHHFDGRWKKPLVFGTPLKVEPSTMTENVISYIKFNPLFTPVFSFVLGLILLARSLPKSTTRLSNTQNAILCLAVSGLFYMGGYSVVGVASDFRYQLWAMIAIFIASVIFISERQWAKFSRADVICASILLGTVIITVTAHALKGDALTLSILTLTNS